MGRLKFRAVITLKLAERYFTDEQRLFMTENPSPDYLDEPNLKVKWHRLRKHLKQKEVADTLEASITTYMDYENDGTVTLTPCQYDKLAELFDTPVEKLLDGYNRFLYLGQREQLKNYRKQHRLTQKELAERLSIQTQRLKRWEQGKNRMSKEWWEKLFLTDC